MGYELDKVMRQYGVASPTASAYVAPPPRDASGAFWLAGVRSRR